MAEDSRKLFVAGLPDTFSEEVLRQLFEATGGNVAEVTLPRDRTTGRPRGFGFVTMATAEEASAAREALHGSFQGGRSISVRPFESDPPRREGGGPGSSGPRSAGGGGGGGGGAGGIEADKERKLYVGNLPYDATSAEVEAAITATGAGPVHRVILPSDGEGKNRGYGFVQFSSADAAKAALDVLRGAELRGRVLRILPAHDKGERPAGGPREGGYGGPREGGYSGGGGGYGGSPGGGGYGGGGGGGGYGGPPANAGRGDPGRGGPPPDFGGGRGGPPKRTFDDKKKRNHDDGGGGGRGRRNKNDWDTGKDDWGDD
jgi:nucleolin